MIYINNSKLGRQGAAVKALERAIEIDPDESSWRLNYSIMLERNAGAKEALEYLQKMKENIKKVPSIRCRMVILKERLDFPCEAEAKEITKEYKDSPHKFSDYDKAHLLKKVFDIAEEPYSYVDPKTSRNLEDEGKYLDVNNLPFKL
jgi:tetratricopeptide (TPR) repeat protein